MKSITITLLLVLCAVTATASVHQVQTYGLVDRVEFEPNEKSPQRIKVWGTFAFLYTTQDVSSVGAADPNSPYAPHRGYLYFKLPPIAKETALREWADLKAVAGTGQLVTFGSWTSVYIGTTNKSKGRNGFVSDYNGKELLSVLTPKNDGAAITYTMDTGITKLPNTGVYVALLNALKAAR
jgi:hypothetical protein